MPAPRIIPFPPDVLVGQTIRRARNRKGLHLADVASALGIHGTSLSRWERGVEPVPHRRRPGLAALLGLREAAIVPPIVMVLTEEEAAWISERRANTRRLA